MGRGCTHAIVFLGLWMIASALALPGHGYGAQMTQKKSTLPVVSSESTARQPFSVKVKKKTRSKKSMSPGGSERPNTSSKVNRQKKSRSLKSSKKSRLKARVQARTDLKSHGLLEDTRRYDPRPDYRTAGVQNPHARNLTHDHFQELDHNQDGKIDPIERAVGRMDMDRDLHSRPHY